MLYAFLAPDVPLPNRTRRAFYFIKVDHFMAEEYDQAFGYDWYTRHWTVVLNKREAQFASHLFPLSVIGAGGWDLYSWVQGYEQFWNAKAAQARTSGDAEAFQQTSTHAANARDFGGTYEELRSNIRFPISNSIRILQSTRFATSSRRSTAAASDLMYSISSTLSSSQRASS